MCFMRSFVCPGQIDYVIGTEKYIIAVRATASENVTRECVWIDVAQPHMFTQVLYGLCAWRKIPNRHNVIDFPQRSGAFVSGYRIR